MKKILALTGIALIGLYGCGEKEQNTATNNQQPQVATQSPTPQETPKQAEQAPSEPQPAPQPEKQRLQQLQLNFKKANNTFK